MIILEHLPKRDYFRDKTLKNLNYEKWDIILELDLIRYTRFLYTPYVYIWYQFDIPACIRYSAGDPNSGNFLFRKSIGGMSDTMLIWYNDMWLVRGLN